VSGEPLWRDKAHHRQTHTRWVEKISRNTGAPDYPDEWAHQQCGGCRYWVPLTSEWGLDWGGCSNVGSSFDRHVMFEHDGCDAFEEADRWVTPGD
jgi:hypothetical protein